MTNDMTDKLRRIADLKERLKYHRLRPQHTDVAVVVLTASELERQREG